jgi:hypothetical protein
MEVALLRQELDVLQVRVEQLCSVVERKQVDLLRANEAKGAAGAAKTRLTAEGTFKRKLMTVVHIETSLFKV